jgi:hypothetical protein
MVSLSSCVVGVVFSMGGEDDSGKLKGREGAKITLCGTWKTES